jgi:hypothetical protein
MNTCDRESRAVIFTADDSLVAEFARRNCQRVSASIYSDDLRIELARKQRRAVTHAAGGVENAAGTTIPQDFARKLISVNVIRVILCPFGRAGLDSLEVSQFFSP